MNVRSCCPSKDMTILFSVRLEYWRTLLMYNIRIHEANIVNPALPAFLHFHPAQLEIKEGNEKSKRLGRARV